MIHYNKAQKNIRKIISSLMNFKTQKKITMIFKIMI